MRVVGYTEFKNHLSQNLDAVNMDREIVVVARKNGKNVVVMDMDDYNAMSETLHLTGNSLNKQRLDEAIAEMKGGTSFFNGLIEE